MKKETVMKVLNRYCKGLAAMEKQALFDKEENDAKQYHFDMCALKEAVKQTKNKGGLTV